MRILSLFTLMVLSSIIVLHAPATVAQDRQYADTERLPADAAMAEDVIGKPVISRKTNEEVGSVATLLFDEAGNIRGAVIKRSGIMGFFSRELAVPWDELELTEDGTALVTDLGRSDMQTATAFQRSD